MLEVIGDVRQPFLARSQRAGVDHRDIVLAQMVEQGRHPLLEQRQPVFHTREAAPLAHGLVERILRGGRTEGLAVAEAEAPDAVLVKQRLAGGEQKVRLQYAGGQLGVRVECPKRFELVAKEIEPQPLVEPAREDVDDRAADSELACVDHRVGAAIALPLQQRGEAVPADLHPRLELAHRLADAEGGEHALGQGIDGGNQQLRPRAPGLQAIERREPSRADRECWAGAVVGQAIPGRKLDHLQLGREKLRCLAHIAHRRLVGRDEHRAPLRSSRQVRHHQRLRPARDRGQRERAVGGQDRGEIGHERSSDRRVR